MAESLRLLRGHNEIVGTRKEFGGAADGIVFAIGGRGCGGQGIESLDHFAGAAFKHSAGLDFGAVFNDYRDGRRACHFGLAIDGVVDAGTCRGARDGHLRTSIYDTSSGREYGHSGHNGLGVCAATAFVVVGVESDICSASPDVLFQARVVNVRIAVVLNAIYGIVARNFLLAHRVLGGPTKQHGDGPTGVGGIFVACQHRTAPRGDFVLVGRGHIEIVAREVALVFIVGLKYGAAVSRRGAGAQFAETASRGPRRVAHLAIGVIAAAAVDIAVCGDEVKQVGVHRIAIVEPTFGEGVLAIVRVAFFAVVTLAAIKTVVGNVGVHIPHFAVGAHIGFLEVVP